MRSPLPLHRKTALAVVASLLVFACQEGGVTALTTESGGTPNGSNTSSGGTGTVAGATDPTATNGDGLSPSEQPTGAQPGTVIVGNANGQQVPGVGNANNANNANVPTGTNPNTPVTTSTPPDWNQFRYAFSTFVVGQTGSAEAPGVELYLTNNADFCVANPNLGMVDNTLGQGDTFLAISFAAPGRSASAGSWMGVGEYDKKALQVRTVGSNAFGPGFCRAAVDKAAYSGNVNIVSDANGSYTFTVQAQLPTASTTTAGKTTTTLSPVNYQLVSTPCNFNYQYYLATSDTLLSGPYNTERPAAMTQISCMAAAQAGASKNRRLQ